MAVVESTDAGEGHHDDVSRGPGRCRGEGVGGTQRRKWAVTAMIHDQKQVCVETGIHGGGSSKPVDVSDQTEQVSAEMRGAHTGGCRT
jgi:hypothetical protein